MIKRKRTRRRLERRESIPGSTTRYEDLKSGYVPKRIRHRELRAKEVLKREGDEE